MALTILSPATVPAQNAAATESSQASSKLRKSAQEFEAILLQSWLEKMNQSFVGSSESQDAAHDTVSSLGTQAIASALAARGGIGIARMLLGQLQPSRREVQVENSGDIAPSDSGFAPAAAFPAQSTAGPRWRTSGQTAGDSARRASSTIVRIARRG
jgi:Rod binding domain-containing protein